MTDRRINGRTPRRGIGRAMHSVARQKICLKVGVQAMLVTAQSSRATASHLPRSTSTKIPAALVDIDEYCGLTAGPPARPVAPVPPTRWLSTLDGPRPYDEAAASTTLCVLPVIIVTFPSYFRAGTFAAQTQSRLLWDGSLSTASAFQAATGLSFSRL